MALSFTEYDILPTMTALAGGTLPKDEVYDGRSFHPQLRGETGTVRDWVFSDHNPLPGWGKEGFYRRRWAQDKRWKLYDDGQFFEYANDVLEENPIPKKQQSAAAAAARQTLQLVLEQMQ